uniref:MADF domain-containing protein n=1 Tax=Anopheles dirus TaxID=7168 RepID=A0A182NN07_9DIPT
MALSNMSQEDCNFWSDFIEIYRTLPVLWSKAHESEPKHLRDRALNILLRKHRERVPSTTIAEIRRLLKTLRAEYRFELRAALEYERATGNGVEYYDSALWYFETLDFLQPEELENLKLELEEAEEKYNASPDSSHVTNNTHIVNTDSDVHIYCMSLEKSLRKLSQQQLRYAKSYIDRVVYCGIMGILSHDWPNIDVTVVEKALNTEPTKDLTEETHHEVRKVPIPSSVKRLKIDLHNSQREYADRSAVLCSVHDNVKQISDEREECLMEQDEDIPSDNDEEYKLHDTDAVSNFDDEEFVLNFRLGRDLVQKLCHHMEMTPEYKKMRGHGGYEAISAQAHVLAFLWFLGQEKATYRDVAKQFNLSVSCVKHVISRVTDVVLGMAANGLGLPNEERKMKSSQVFSTLSNIPCTIGCVGGTQIRIDKPVDDAERYLLRKGYYAIQLQAIIDENFHFVDVFVEYPGEPELIESIREMCGEQYCLVGGTAYPCLHQLLVPYRSNGKPLTVTQNTFNERLETVLKRYYSIFLRLKQRFRQLYHLKGRNMNSVVKLIKVCCMLHNLAAAEELEQIASKTDEQREEAIASVRDTSDEMGTDCMQPGKRGLTLSVIVLGGACLTVMLAYLAFGDSTDESGLRTLRMVSIIFRHGDRSPTDFYPNDPHRNHHWTGGLSALSEKGSQQMYHLGKLLRPRYYRLLPPNGLYSKEHMTIVSSYAERCIMSAQSFIAGFLPPLENTNPLPIPWQPAAINVLPRDRDTILAQKQPCPRYEQSKQRLLAYPPKDIRELYEKNAALFRTLSQGTGQNISTILDVELLYNTLEIEKSAGLELPDWTEGIFPQKMLPIAERSLALITELPLMKKIKGGAIVGELLDNAIRRRSGILIPERNIFIYSGHDVTLVNLMRALNVIEQTSGKPDFSATIVFELHHSITFDDDFEVKIVYFFNSDDKYPKEIEIPNCESPCSLTKFEQVMETVRLRNYDETCQLIHSSISTGCETWNGCATNDGSVNGNGNDGANEILSGYSMTSNDHVRFDRCVHDPRPDEFGARSAQYRPVSLSLSSCLIG